MFITAVCVIFLIKLRWPKNKSLNRLNWMLRAGTDENVCVCGGCLFVFSRAFVEVLVRQNSCNCTTCSRAIHYMFYA